MTDVRAIHVSGYEREPGDFYPTPFWVTECLLRHVELRGPIWEPCCGDGAIAKVLTAAGHEVVASDIADYGFGRPGVDILEEKRMPEGCRALVTNPPYGDGGSSGRAEKAASQMLTFTAHVLRLAEQARGQLALLVRFQWIAGKRVATLLSSVPLDKVIVLTRRIQWFDHGERTKAGQHHHAWIVVDFERPAGRRPELVFADGPKKQQGGKPRPIGDDTLPLFGTLPSQRQA
jgi:hypothetical protein